MKLLVNVFFTLILAFTAASADDTSNGPALMIVRFNQKNINYHDKLAYVVREAVKTKSSVIFDVVDVTPGEKPGLYGQQIASDIENLGVPAAQVNVRTENSAVTNEEVRIFVR